MGLWFYACKIMMGIAHTPTPKLVGSQENVMLMKAFTQGEMPLQGQDRLFFPLRLEGLLSRCATGLSLAGVIR